MIEFTLLFQLSKSSDLQLGEETRPKEYDVPWQFHNRRSNVDEVEGEKLISIIHSALQPAIGAPIAHKWL